MFFRDTTTMIVSQATIESAVAEWLRRDVLGTALAYGIKVTAFKPHKRKSGWNYEIQFHMVQRDGSEISQ